MLFCLVLAPPRRLTQGVENYIRIPPTLNQRYGGEIIAFFAAEAKASEASWVRNDLFLFHATHVLCVGKYHIRGAPTTGFKWHFIIVDPDADGDGAKYWVSELIEWKIKRSSTSRERPVEGTSDESDPALVAGILSSWVSMLDPVVFSKKEADVYCY